MNAPPFQYPEVETAARDAVLESPTDPSEMSSEDYDAAFEHEPADSNGHASTNGNAGRRKASARVEVLTPGVHATPEGSVEVGNHDFANDVLGRFPPDTLYRRGTVGEIVGEPGQRQFRPSSNDDLRIRVDSSMRVARWVSRKGPEGETSETEVYTPCTRDQSGIVLAAAMTDKRVPEIKSLTPYPVYLPNFTLCRPGYSNGIYYDEPRELAGLSLEIDRDVIRTTFRDLMIDFPFRADADRQNVFGLLLTPILAMAIDGNRPMHLIHSPMERTGKTKIAEEMLGGIVIGRRTPAQQMTESVEETDKRMLATLIRGETLLHLDNLRDFLDSPVIASLLTASTYQGRILGSTRMIDVPNTLSIVATGNNVRATGEIVKRTIPIRLQPKTDRPEDRTDFHHPNFFAYVLEHRRQIMGCLLGAVELWKRAGKPRGNVPMGGFDEWAATVGGIMGVLGFDDFMGNVREWRQSSDTRRSDLEALVNEWHVIHGTGMAKAGELLEIANRLELFGDALAGKEGKAAQIAFGMRVLAKNTDMPVGAFIIRKSDLSRPATYFLGKSE